MYLVDCFLTLTDVLKMSLILFVSLRIPRYDNSFHKMTAFTITPHTYYLLTQQALFLCNFSVFLASCAFWKFVSKRSSKNDIKTRGTDKIALRQSS